MTKRHILMADPHGLAEFMKPALAKLNPNLELLSVADGARCITAHAKLCNAKVPPLVTVIPDEIDLVSGRKVAITLRTVERKLGVPATAIIYLQSESGDADGSKQWGRAVSITRGPIDQPKREAMRLIKAIAKVLSQLTGRGRK
ncbi:MAG: hypothetical protein CMH52_13025 [Myxococcales bacterium]|nr:hypothetical protein [Myxococcales bacterium]